MVLCSKATFDLRSIGLSKLRTDADRRLLRSTARWWPYARAKPFHRRTRISYEATYSAVSGISGPDPPPVLEYLQAGCMIRIRAPWQPEPCSPGSTSSHRRFVPASQIASLTGAHRLLKVTWRRKVIFDNHPAHFSKQTANVSPRPTDDLCGSLPIPMTSTENCPTVRRVTAFKLNKLVSRRRNAHSRLVACPIEALADQFDLTSAPSAFVSAGWAGVS
jgi:hypothetical protein